MVRVVSVLVGVAAMAAGIPAPAHAQDKAGFYVGAEAGASFSESTKWKDSEDLGVIWITFPTAKNADAGAGGVYGVVAGYRFNDMLRAELGVDYRSGHSVSTSQDLQGAGFLAEYKVEIDAWTFMASGYVEPVRLGAFKPYAGGGIGMAVVRSKNASVRFDGSPGFALPGENETNFAWQLGAGVAYELTPVVTVDLGYRHLDAGRVTVGRASSVAGGWAQQTKGALVTDEVLLGLRYQF